MTQDEIIRMARECGDWNGQTAEFNDVGLERFAALVAAHEREACAEECDRYSERWMFGNTPVGEQTLSLMKRCAAAIRARSDQ